MTDGRDEYIRQTIPSALSMLQGPLAKRFIFDDSGDDAYREWLGITFPTFELLFEPRRQGFGGAIKAAWEHMKDCETDYIFHLEDDFIFNGPIPLDAMVDVLEAHPYLYQIALKRQPWWPSEVEAGGILERHQEAFTQKEGWLEHRRYFTTNPGLYRRSLTDRGWIDGANSEGLFTHGILDTDPDAQFGLWGQRADPPRVHHIGNLRSGTQY